MLFKKKSLLKPLSILPALFIMCSIGSFSGQTGEDSGQLSLSVSQKIIEVGNFIFQTDLPQEEIDHLAEIIDGPVRKIAHMTEYALLAISLFIPFTLYQLKNMQRIALVICICISYACIDEFHQTFVNNRSGSIKDVLIDSIGVLVAVSLAQLYISSNSNRRNRT